MSAETEAAAAVTAAATAATEAAAATAATEAAAAAAAATGTTPWHSDITGEDKGYLTNRGLDKLSGPKEALLKTIQAHKAAEKSLGIPADKVLRIPEPNDEEGWNTFYAKLGRPETAEKYEFDSGDKPFDEFVKTQLYKMGISADAGRAFSAGLKSHLETAQSAEADTAKLELQTQKGELKTEWGATGDAKMVVAQRAAAALGVSADGLNALETVLGYKAVMNMFLDIGSKIGEDKFIKSDHQEALVTKDGAIAELSRLFADKIWSEAYGKGGVEERRKADALHAIAYS